MPALPPVFEKVKISSFGSYAHRMLSGRSLSSLGSKSSNITGSKGLDSRNRNFTNLGSANGSEVDTQANKPSDEIPLGAYQIGVKRVYDVYYHDQTR
jgi:hypothetical protein